MSFRDDRPQPARILLVEDGHVQALFVEAALASLPQLDLLHVTKDGAEAMEFLRGEVQSMKGRLPDLILLDISMPKKDGFEVLAELKSDPRLRRVPVVVFSTSDSQEEIDRAYDKGASTFITKPVTLADLTHVLSRIAEYWVETARLPTNLQASREATPRIWLSAG
jgi:two-component system response regulator